LCVLSIIYMSNNPDGEYCPMSQAIRGDAEKKRRGLEWAEVAVKWQLLRKWQKRS
jgi:metal-sulfur cluster biosynthetic enzyme